MKYYNFIKIRGEAATDTVDEFLCGIGAGTMGSLGTSSAPVVTVPVKIPDPPIDSGSGNWQALVNLLGDGVALMLPGAGTSALTQAISCAVSLVGEKEQLVRQVGEIVLFQVLDGVKEYIVERFLKGERRDGELDGSLVALNRIADALRSRKPNGDLEPTKSLTFSAQRSGEALKAPKADGDRLEGTGKEYDEDLPSLTSSADLANFVEQEITMDGERIFRSNGSIGV